VWYVIFLLTIVNVFNTLDRMALSILLPFIKTDLQLSDSQLGLLTGLAFAVFYALCGIPIARWADRGVRRNITALALATWSMATALSGAAQNFWHLFLARVGVGAGEGGGLPPAQSLICDYVPLERRPGAFAVHAFGLVVGMMLGLALAGRLGETIGWRWTFVVLGLPGIALALIVRLTLREPARGFFDPANATVAPATFGETLGMLWRIRTYRFLMFANVVNGFVQYGLNQWWPSFYTRTFALSLSSVGFYLGAAIGVGSGIGLLLGGLLSNKAAQRDIRLPLMLGAVAMGLALFAALGSLLVPSAAVSILLVSLTALLWNVLTAPLSATVYSMAAPQMRATAGAFILVLTSIFGFGLGPVCVGVVSDALTPALGAHALRYALLAPICLMPVVILMLVVATKTLPSELRAGARVAS
jgi:predicted MFS family arabinose efflux permease